MVINDLRSLNSKKATALFESLVDGVLRNSSDLIFQSKQSLQAFGCYSIHETDQEFKIYKNKVYVSSATSYKCALAWCIANKNNIKTLQNDIDLFQKELSWRKNEIEFYKHAINQPIPSERKYVIEDKLLLSIQRAKHLRKQLNKCLDSAKYIQQKGFNNETSRLGINSRSRKNSKSI